MKKYIGKKTIMAKPMAKSEAEKVLNRSLADAKGGEDGYLVEYQDGYKSWSPKETFEQAYKIADTHLDRMRIEYAEVMERFAKLEMFTLSEEFRAMPKPKQVDLRTQCGAIFAYIGILGRRIRRAVVFVQTSATFITRGRPVNVRHFNSGAAQGLAVGTVLGTLGRRKTRFCNRHRAAFFRHRNKRKDFRERIALDVKLTDRTDSGQIRPVGFLHTEKTLCHFSNPFLFC